MPPTFDEFDACGATGADATPAPATPPRPARSAPEARRASRLVARLFRAADLQLRARLLASLMRPLGALGIAGVAAGAFVWALPRSAVVAEATIDLDRVAGISGEQVLELARFAEQVDPRVLLDFAAMVEASHLGVAGLSAAALLLLVRALPAATPRAAAPRGR